MKAFIETDLPEPADAFGILDKLRTFKGIRAVHAVTAARIKVKYDSRRLIPVKVLVLIEKLTVKKKAA